MSFLLSLRGNSETQTSFAPKQANAVDHYGLETVEALKPDELVEGSYI